MKSDNIIYSFEKYYEVVSRVKCIEELMQFANERYEHYSKFQKEASENPFPSEMNEEFVEKITTLHMSDQYLEFMKFLTEITKEAQKEMHKMADPAVKFREDHAQNS
jgi:mRNA-degrading endonuclease RelE of RelBE toxin-antitoxin system